MSRISPIRLVVIALLGFGVGLMAGFAWSLLKPHRVSRYRVELNGES
ncbi:MAG: hypothetical protein U0990_01780 [Candidatus Nanopelagicales bacterium]|nr:hypothetical protein [Candidatus Nanopelagicales bacterium]MDZ4248798.1 hypothetical protein [Candidatus Nanopelagicales bacterium]MDZ7577105.1 hypothetical protein [Candidatus Nanopelagicales bacterium]